MERIYGPKYHATKDLTKVQVAALIRADIKAAVAARELPPLVYSVKTHLYSGGGSIDVRVRGFEAPRKGPRFPVVAPAFARGETDGRSGTDYRLTPEARLILEKLKAMMDAYNYDGSDIQTDYFDVRFYGDASFDWREEQAQRERLAAEKADPPPPAGGFCVMCQRSHPFGDHRPALDPEPVVANPLPRDPPDVLLIPTPFPMQPAKA